MHSATDMFNIFSENFRRQIVYITVTSTGHPDCYTSSKHRVAKTFKKQITGASMCLTSFSVITKRCKYLMNKNFILNLGNSNWINLHYYSPV